MKDKTVKAELLELLESIKYIIKENPAEAKGGIDYDWIDQKLAVIKWLLNHSKKD